MHKNFLLSFANLPIVFRKNVCYNVVTKKERNNR